MTCGQGTGLEDRIASFLARVPLADIERALTRVAPGCAPRDMSIGEVVRTLGVAGVADLAGVRRSTVLEAAGPEACALSDLIAPNPWGHLRGNDVSCCSSCGCGGGGGFRGPSVPAWGIPAGRQPPLGGYASPDPSGYLAEPPLPGAASAAGAGDPSRGMVSRYGAPEAQSGYGTSRAAYEPSRDRFPRRNPEEPLGSVEPVGPLSPAQQAAEEAAAAQGGGGFAGWPGNVAFRPDAWNFAEGWYILQRDDTFSGLAGTYLESPARWHEIWALQPYRYTKAPDPSSATPSRPLVQIGERVIMPAEATERAKELYRSGATRAPAIGGVGGTPKGAGAPMSNGAVILLAAIGVGLVGAVAYGVSGS